MIASQTSHMRNRHWKIVFASLALCLLAAVAYAQAEADFLALVADEVPAGVAHEVFIGERRAWPQTVDGHAAVTAAGSR